ncbi:DUF721 domain-containing protein [Actinomyces sp. zg-332]|uniref:DUF721 domain-containing protein n=1 Tax=Actinomyces sp. zg-332 TaxID=2708340 RepID=UPI00142167BC|nr:DciA family protein [Actinomyces sp. zg-332]QPK94150.1 DUF721 domain-containing protein [Actinomyces sp. zg-332]
MSKNVDINDEENVEKRLVKVIEETFTRLKLDENLYKLKEKYKTKKKKENSKTNDNSVFAKGYKDPVSFGECMNQVLNDNDWDEKLLYGKIISNWENLAGINNAKHAKIEKIEDKTLYLRVSSTNWATTLRMLQDKIQRNIDIEIGHGIIKKIVIIPPSKPSWKKGKYHINGRGPRDTYG